jgi:hypothetical protein
MKQLSARDSRRLASALSVLAVWEEDQDGSIVLYWPVSDGRLLLGLSRTRFALADETGTLVLEGPIDPRWDVTLEDEGRQWFVLITGPDEMTLTLATASVNDAGELSDILLGR